MQESERDLISVAEVAEQLNVGKNTVYALLKVGEIAAFRIGKPWKIPQSSVDQFISDNTKKKGRLFSK